MTLHNLAETSELDLHSEPFHSLLKKEEVQNVFFIILLLEPQLCNPENRSQSDLTF